MKKKFLTILLYTFVVLFSYGCGNTETKVAEVEATEETSMLLFEDFIKTSSMELQYAEQFTVDYYKGEYAMISIKDSGKYFVESYFCRI